MALAISGHLRASSATVASTAAEWFRSASETEARVPCYVAVESPKDENGMPLGFSRFTYVLRDEKNEYKLTEARLRKNGASIGLAYLTRNDDSITYGPEKALRVPPDFAHWDRFPLRLFESVPIETPDEFKFDAPPEASLKNGVVIVRRTLAHHQRESLRSAILARAEMIDQVWRAAGFSPKKGRVTDSIPLEAVYVIWAAKPFLLSDTFYNEKGKIVGPLRNFSSVSFPDSVDLEKFNVPKQRRYLYAKDPVEYLALVSTLVPGGKELHQVNAQKNE